MNPLHDLVRAAGGDPDTVGDPMAYHVDRDLGKRFAAGGGAIDGRTGEMKRRCWLLGLFVPQAGAQSMCGSSDPKACEDIARGNPQVEIATLKAFHADMWEHIRALRSAVFNPPKPENNVCPVCKAKAHEYRRQKTFYAGGWKDPQFKADRENWPDEVVSYSDASSDKPLTVYWGPLFRRIDCAHCNATFKQIAVQEKL